ncbi:MAG TPA: hypothetical protein VGK20_06415 [Candidatus Binatia bacterium]
MKAWKNIVTTDVVVFVVLFLALMAVGPSSLMHDPGVFWHLRVGNHVLETGTLIRTDTFSSTFPGKQWLAHAWLFDIVQALIQRIDGFDTLLLATAASLAALYAWVTRRLLHARLQPEAAILVVTFTVAATAYQFQPRPLVVTFAIFGWMYARLVDFEAGRIPLVRMFWLVPAIVVWANVHGAVVGGVATIAICAAGWTLAPLLGWPSPISSLRSLAAVCGLVAACIAALFVNPYGPLGSGLVRQWFSVVSSPEIARLMMEHAPVSFSDPASWFLVGFGAVFVAALIGVPWRRLRVTWLLPLVWLAMACSRVRHGPLFAMAAALALAEMFHEVRWIRWLTHHGSELLKPAVRAPDAPARRMALPAALVGICLVLEIARIDVPVIGHGWNRLDPDWWPVGMLGDLHAYEQARGPGAPVFNEMLFGGFLIYFTPGIGVFIDDRCELYGDARLAEYSRALAGDMTVFEQWGNQYGFDLALVLPGSPFDSYLRSSPDWELLRQSKAATLFRRRAAP